MADQNPKQQSNEPDRGQQQSSQNQPGRDDQITQQTQGTQKQDEPWTDDAGEDTESPDRTRTSREPASIADDRGRSDDMSRRNFGRDREADELGSETDENLNIDESDEEESGRSDR